jgi:hypothetical protein
LINKLTQVLEDQRRKYKWLVCTIIFDSFVLTSVVPFLIAKYRGIYPA